MSLIVKQREDREVISTPCDEITICLQQLTATDYKAIKYAEGLISEADYAPIKAERQALRDRINELEAEL